MSTPMFDMPEHFPIDIREDGEGPETNPELVVATVCWSCVPHEDWPCAAKREEIKAYGKTLGIDL